MSTVASKNNAARLHTKMFRTTRVLLSGSILACSGSWVACSDGVPRAENETALDESTCKSGGPGASTATPFPFPGKAPGVAHARVEAGSIVLENAVLATSWKISTTLTGDVAKDIVAGTSMPLTGEIFEIALADGITLRSSEMKVLGPAILTDLPAACESPKLADHHAGKMITVEMKSEGSPLAVTFQAVLRDGSNYVRQTLHFRAEGAALPVRTMMLQKLTVPSAVESGTVDGSPVIVDRFFLGYEHPIAQNKFAVPTDRVGTWSPEDAAFPAKKLLKWDVTPFLSKPDTFEVGFHYTAGGYRLQIYRLVLLENGIEIARDEHFGATGTKDVDNSYKIALASRKSGATYELQAEVLSDGGADSSGFLEIASRSEKPFVFGRLLRDAPIEAGEVVTQSSVIGVVPEGQLRRGFLHYVERERPHPYRTFLHYNSWYDIGYFTPYTEKDAIGVIRAFGSELVEKRGVTLDSYLFDDGWDDPATLWNFSKAFPNGFSAVKAAAEEYGTAPGIWLSPWGGYGDPQKKRVALGSAQGYETNSKGFVLSAPKYYERFHDITLELVKKYGINQFKFDGIGRGGGRYPGSKFGSDFEAAIALIGDLRAANPNLYVNLTTGTWASPFWLLHADSIWRGGYDHEFLGVGTDRQKWLTFSHAMTYTNIVKQGPLFPLSSLMLHGIIYAKSARKLATDPGNDLRSEIRLAFGCGTQLQEMYITPSLLSQANWDDLAASAKWARDRAPTLRDTHWIGGDPKLLEPYGWASLSQGKGVLVLRNPSDKVQSISIDVAKAFELPAGAPKGHALKSPYADQRILSLELEAAAASMVTLEPFEVLVFDAEPSSK